MYGISVVWECRYDRLCSHQAKHAAGGNMTWGVDGDTGSLADMTELGVWDPLSVKVQTYKTAIEVCGDNLWYGFAKNNNNCVGHCVLALCSLTIDNGSRCCPLVTAACVSDRHPYHRHSCHDSMCYCDNNTLCCHCVGRK